MKPFTRPPSWAQGEHSPWRGSPLPARAGLFSRRPTVRVLDHMVSVRAFSAFVWCVHARFPPPSALHAPRALALWPPEPARVCACSRWAPSGQPRAVSLPSWLPALDGMDTCRPLSPLTGATRTCAHAHTHMHTHVHAHARVGGSQGCRAGKGWQHSPGAPTPGAPRCPLLSAPSRTAATETSTTRRVAGAPTCPTSWRRTRRSSALRRSWRTGAGGGLAAHPTTPSRSVARVTGSLRAAWGPLSPSLRRGRALPFRSASSLVLSSCSGTPPVSCPKLAPKAREEELQSVFHPWGCTTQCGERSGVGKRHREDARPGPEC